jgi:aspartate aminotransferase
MTILNEMIREIPPSPTLAMSEKASALAKQGIKVVNLSVGEPDIAIPEWVRQAAIQAIQDGCHLYTPVAGMPQLKEAIAQKLRTENSLDYQTDEICVSGGAKQVIYNAFQVSLSHGQEVIIPAPYWVSYPPMVALAKGKCVVVPCQAKNDFKITPNDLQKSITEKTRWFVLNSPNNPTGAVYSAAELSALADVLLQYPHVWILSDDIYEHLSYAPFHSIVSIAPALKERTLLVNGLSKSFAMTGWRIGYGAGPKSLISGMSKLQSHSTSGACCIAQCAGIQALTSPQSAVFLKTIGALFRDRRDTFVHRLSQFMPVRMPQGAFYVYANVKELMRAKNIASDIEFCNQLLTQAHVSGVPGTEFGLSDYVRLSYALDVSLLNQAADNIERWINN